ncbi:Uncharacterized protein Adt_09634 [Abeliophyllum distichum]|uniref:Uncharacterized protein n=1 Tax=Abeliophyllum distichum TaxID=126358 RepID=A0ABD1UHP8_9LAMI
MVPASLYLGFAASIIWVAQGTYLTSTAHSHANDYNLHEGTIIGKFNGEFWGMFASHQNENLWHDNSLQLRAMELNPEQEFRKKILSSWMISIISSSQHQAWRKLLKMKLKPYIRDFKCNSAVWKVLRAINPAKEKNPWIDEIHKFPVEVPMVLAL